MSVNKKTGEAPAPISTSEEAFSQLVTRATTKRLFAKAGVERVAKDTTAAFIPVIRKVVEDIVGQILELGIPVNSNSKETGPSRKIKVADVLKVTPDIYKDKVGEVLTHRVIRIPGKDVDGNAGTEEEEDAPEEKKDSDADDNAETEEEEEEKKGSDDEKEKDAPLPVRAALYHAHAPMKVLMKLLLQELSPDEPHSFADKAVTAVLILTEQRLLVFAGYVNRAMALKKPPRRTATPSYLELVLEIISDGLG